jgi:hypothetical protein
MKYTSTRAASKLYSFEDALCSGYAPDGGLFVPQSLPDKIQAKTLKEWATLNYVDLATDVLSLFISSNEISKLELQKIVTVSLSAFEEPVVPVKPIPSRNSDEPTLYVVELFHGPTFCFKDLSLQFVIQSLNYFAVKRGRNITLVVSTTGDTGPAAVQAVEDCQSPHLGILVHYPQGQISDFQRKQLTTCTNEKIKIVAFQGGGDDMDAPIKSIMTDTTFSQSDERLICGVNSYNIARPLMQMVHFIWAYLRVAESLHIEPGDPGTVLSWNCVFRRQDCHTNTFIFVTYCYCRFHLRHCLAHGSHGKHGRGIYSQKNGNTTGNSLCGCQCQRCHAPSLSDWHCGTLAANANDHERSHQHSTAVQLGATFVLSYQSRSCSSSGMVYTAGKGSRPKNGAARYHVVCKAAKRIPVGTSDRRGALRYSPQCVDGSRLLGRSKYCSRLLCCEETRLLLAS